MGGILKNLNLTSYLIFVNSLKYLIMISKKTNQKQYGFPDESEIEKVIKRMIQPGYRRINQGLPLSATAEEKTKYNLCKGIVHHAIKSNLTEKELLKQLGVDQEKIEFILFCHIDKLTVEELNHYSNVLNINSYNDKSFFFSEMREKNILLILKSYHNNHKWL